MIKSSFIYKYFAEIYFILLAIIFIISRIILVGNHFPHYDDFYAPYLITLMNSYEPLFFAEQLIKYGGEIGGVISSFTLEFFTNNQTIFSIFKFLLTPIAIAKTSTYAPLQFYFTALTMNLDVSYEYSKISMRLPSLIISSITLFIFYLYARKFKTEEKFYILVVGGTILSLSWMFLVYSSQASNTVASLFSLICLIYLLERFKDNKLKIITSLFLGLMISLLCLSHYQFLFFLPGFYFSIFYGLNFSIRKFIYYWIPALLVNVVTVIGIYFIFLKDRLLWNPGVSWNAGLNKEFIFDVSCGYGWLGCLYDVFASNIFIVFQSIVSFSNSSSISSLLYTSIIIALSVFGLLYLFLRNDKSIIIFIIISFLVWIFLVGTNRLAFSPTRHSLVLLIIISILSSYGALFLSKFLFPLSTKYKYLFTTLLCSLALFVFIYSFQEQKNLRNDPLKQANIESLLNKYKPNFIIKYGMGAQFEFIPLIREKYESNYKHKFPSYFLYKKLNPTNKDLIMTFCGSEDLCDAVESNITKNLINDNFGKKNNNYKLIYKFEHISNIFNCFTSKAGSGTNSAYIGIWEY